MYSNKIRLLYLGVFAPHCSDAYRVKGLNESEKFEVHRMDFRKLFRQSPNEAVNIIIGKCKELKIELILINKGEVFTPQDLFKIRAHTDAKLYYWYGDMRDELEPFVKANVAQFDYVFVNAKDKDYYKQLTLFGAKKIVYSHTATDGDTFRKINSPGQENYDVAFFGGNYHDKFRGSKFRTNIVNKLINDNRVKMLVHGTGWSEGKPLVYGDDFANVASHSKILLSISNYEDVRYYTSNRLWNCLACGFTLVHRFNGVDELLKDNKEVVVFDNYNDLIDKILFYKDNVVIRNNIFLEGRSKVLSEHTYKNRALDMAYVFIHDEMESVK